LGPLVQLPETWSGHIPGYDPGYETDRQNRSTPPGVQPEDLLMSRSFVASQVTPKVSKVAAEWSVLQLRIREVPGSNLGLDTDYPERGIRGFPQSLHLNAGKVSLP
jgi:hypothetical protein